MQRERERERERARERERERERARERERELKEFVGALAMPLGVCWHGQEFASLSKVFLYSLSSSRPPGTSFSRDSLSIGIDFMPTDFSESGLSFLRLGSSLVNGGWEEVGKREDKGVSGSC